MKNLLTAFLLVVLLAGFYGCAGTLPGADFKKPIADAHRLCVNDEASVKVAAVGDVVLTDTVRQRLETGLRDAINARKKAVPCKTDDKRSFVLDSKITRYEEGNAVARLMLAGLGQIHVDGDFALLLTSATGSEPACEFSLNKTFAWGGLYGGMTRMEDIETTFCKAVAEAIVGNASEKTEAPANQGEAQK